MSKIKGNPPTPKGFFVTSRGRTPRVTEKSTPNGTAKIKRVEARPRVGVFKHSSR